MNFINTAIITNTIKIECLTNYPLRLLKLDPEKLS